MNKKFLVGITTVLVSAFAAYGVSRSMNNSNTELSEFTLANIEALAQSEGGDCTIPCVRNGYACIYWGDFADGSGGFVRLYGMRSIYVGNPDTILKK